MHEDEVKSENIPGKIRLVKLSRYLVTHVNCEISKLDERLYDKPNFSKKIL